MAFVLAVRVPNTLGSRVVSMFDPSTICARTAAGESELALARQGLSVVQRRLLSLLNSPSVLSELIDEHRLDPARVERDLVRLRDTGLITLHAPTSAAPPPASPPLPASPSRPAATSRAPAGVSSSAPVAGAAATVVIGGGATSRPAIRRAAIVVALVVLAGGGWFTLRSAPAPQAATANPAPSAAVDAAPPADANAAAAAAALPAAVAEASTALPGPVLRVSTSDSRTPAVDARTTAVRTEPTLPLRGADPAPAIARDRRNDAPPIAVPTATPAGATASAAPAAPPLAASAPPPTETASAPAGQPVQVATAAPPASATRPVARPSLQPVSREQPEFPRDALAAGIDHGTVKARLTIDAGGKVTGVEILESQPRRVFDRAVIRALSRWQFEPDAGVRSSEVEVAFKSN